MANPQEIIARCTRDGVTSWQNVALQLGCSVDAARRGYDPKYLTVRPWPYPCVEVEPEPEPIDENDVRSLAPKGPGMRVQIAELLRRHGPMSVLAIAGILGRPPMSVRVRLARMCKDGWVRHDNPDRRSGLHCEWTWTLTEEGRNVAVTGYAGEDRSAA